MMQHRVHHHPGPEILAEYAAGQLHSGAMLVIGCHLEGCVICCQEAGLWESVGGALLEDSEPVEMSEGALARMMARLDESQAQLPCLPSFVARFDIPKSLAALKIGRRRFVSPAIWFAPVQAGDGSTRTYLVYAKAGTMLAEHSHRGREFTQVLTGAFSDDTGRYGLGDFALTDDALSHAPTVTGDGECLCLISAEAPMKLKSLPARILQAMTGSQY
jgi:putative transcriptional regulator